MHGPNVQNEPPPAAKQIQRQPLVVLFVAACVGICADRWLTLGVPRFALPLSILSLVLWAVSLTVRTFDRRVSVWFLLAAVAIASAGWHHFFWRLVPADHVALHVLSSGARPAALRGRVTTAPEFRPLPDVQPLATIPQGVRSDFRVRVTEIRDHDQWVSASGHVDVIAQGHLLGLRAGDRVEMFGTLVVPQGAMNPGQQDFRLLGRHERVFCRLDVRYPSCVSVIGKSGFAPAALVGDIRVAGLQSLDRFVSPERGDLAGALLLGARDRLDDSRVERFFHTGTIHLLAISGLHVGILAWAFFFFARQQRSREPILIGLMLLTLLYCLLTGVRPPVLRATVLIIVVCVGLIVRRRVLAWNALAAAALVLLILCPAALFSSGAQLSFIAVATLIWLGLNLQDGTTQPVDRLIATSRPWHERMVVTVWLRTRQLAVVSLSIWLVTSPLVMNRFHVMSPIALVLNVVLMVPVTLGLLSGFLVLLSGSWFEPLARMSGVVCDRCLWFFESLVDWAHGIPGGWFWVAGPGTIWCGVFYIVLAGIVLVPRLKPTRSWAIALVMMWIAAPVPGGLVRQAMSGDETLRCTFLSVGHGTCVVLELPDNRVLIYDCGRMGTPRAGVEIVSGFLWHRGISHVDGMIISHADADHYNIAPGLAERISIGEILVTPFMFDSDAPGVVVLRERLELAGVPCRPVWANDVIRCGDVALRILHPTSTRMDGSDNANSILVEIEFQGRKILLPGDLESPGLEAVMAEESRDVDVLMAPHHGSPRSFPQLFADWCTPEWVIISAGKDHLPEANDYDVFSSLGANVMRTAEVGAVTVTVQNGDLHVDTFLPRPNSESTAPRE